MPALETHTHRSTGSGVALSGVGMFLLVFGIQEGEQYDWATAIWAMIVAGLVVLGLFVLWQARNTQEPLVPLGLFRDRNFSLANVGISVMGFAITAMAIPLMLYAQVVRGLSPTRAALLLVPMAVMTIVLARPVGKLTDSVHPRLIAGVGFAATIVVARLAVPQMTPDVVVWQTGRRRWCCSASATPASGRPTPRPRPATCRSSRPAPAPGVYNANRQVGAVLGSAAIAVLIDARLAAEGLPAFAGTGSTGGGCRRRSRTAFARRWRPRCCSRRRCWCWGWSRRCSSSDRGTRGRRCARRPGCAAASADTGSAPAASG